MILFNLKSKIFRRGGVITSFYSDITRKLCMCVTGVISTPGAVKTVIQAVKVVKKPMHGFGLTDSSLGTIIMGLKHKS